MKLLACFLIVGCAAPTYWEVSTFGGQSTFGRPVNDFETAGVMVTAGWAIGEVAHRSEVERLLLVQAEHDKTLIQLSMASLADHRKVPVSEIQDAADTAFENEAEEEHIPFMPDVPETTEQANNLMIWVLAAMCMGLMGALVFLVKSKGKG